MFNKDLTQFVFHKLNNKAGKDFKETPEQAKALVDSLNGVFKANPAEFESSVAKYSDDPEAKSNFGSGWMLDGQLLIYSIN